MADLLGVRQSTNIQTVKHFNKLESYCRTAGQGHKKSTDERDEWYLMQAALRNRHSTSLELSWALAPDRNEAISGWTVRRRLNEGGMDTTAH